MIISYLLLSQQLGRGGKYYLYIVGNFMRFPKVKKVTADYKRFHFSGHGVYNQRQVTGLTGHLAHLIYRSSFKE